MNDRSIPRLKVIGRRAQLQKSSVLYLHRKNIYLYIKEGVKTTNAFPFPHIISPPSIEKKSGNLDCEKSLYFLR